MKRLQILGILTCMFLPSQGYAQQLHVSETSFHFGTIDESSGTVYHDFHFTNTGKKPLVIKQILTSCGCTSAEWSKQPYAPGSQGTIRVIYNPANRSETDFNMVAEIYANQKTTVVLSITGQVKRGARAEANVFDLSKGNSQKVLHIDQRDDYERITARLRDQLYKEHYSDSTDEATARLSRRMTIEGIWPDIDYACFFRTIWEPSTHLIRLRQMAISYTCPHSRLYGNDILYQAITSGLKAWIQRKPTSHNWWYNQISAPQLTADILALMEAGFTPLPANISQDLMQLMEKSDPRKWTGANKIDIAAHHLIRGCILKNDSIVSTNVREIFQPVCITKNEGIREDMSYQQHGPQLYIGGYGTVFVENIARLGVLFTGTKYAMNDQQLDLFSAFVRDTYLRVFRSHYIDFSVGGRSISRINALNYGSYGSLFERLKVLDPSHASEYEKIARCFSQESPAVKRTDRNTLFHISDYMLHNRHTYDFSVRTNSTRTFKTESGNGENLWGTYMSEGATNIRQRGDEYFNIFPVWEWDKIPGTTVPSGETENHNSWGARGKTNFTGGVSDGRYGVMAFSLEDYGIHADKAWFMFDKEIVCLGTGIHSSNVNEILTAVNQCHLRSDVYVANGKDMECISPDQHLQRDFKGWVWHDGIGYYFPENCTLHIKNQVQQGNWAKINFNYSAQNIEMPVFNMWLSHGRHPQEERYAYIIVPNVKQPKQLTKKDFLKDIVIESNSAAIQAVRHKKLNQLQAVFYKPGILQCGQMTIQALKPCVVLVNQFDSPSPDIRISDPTQEEDIIPGRDLILTRP